MPAAQLPETVSATELDLEALAARFHFDLLLTSMGMADARVLNTTKLKSTAVMIDIPPRFYADMTHPSPDGHGFIAELTARHISRQLRKHGCGLDGGGEASNEASHGGTRNGHEASPEALDSSRSVCYHTADRLPVAASNGFELVDEGAAKGVKKLGYISRRLNDTLDLGPIATNSCGFATVTLGYLRTFHADAGAFNISCHGGCTCSCHKCRHVKALDVSFPVVQTSSVRKQTEHQDKYVFCKGDNCLVDDIFAMCHSADDPLACASITVTTKFDLEKKRASDTCFVRLTHISWPTELNASRVRVDYLSLSHIEERNEYGQGCQPPTRLVNTGRHTRADAVKGAGAFLPWARSRT